MDQQKDNLEEFFRRSFEEFDNKTAAEDWDSPSEGVWTGIEAGIGAAATKTATPSPWIKGNTLFIFLFFILFLWGYVSPIIFWVFNLIVG